VRIRATALLSTAEAVDAAARAAALARTEHHLETVRQRVELAAAEVGRLETEYNSFVRQDRSLDPYGRPNSIVHGEELIARASADHTESRNRFDKIKGAREALERRIGEARQSVAAFQSMVESLADVAPASIDAATDAFTETIEAARSRRTAVREALKEADALLAETTRIVRVAADKLAQYAADPRFESVASPVRRQIVAVDRETLPDYAADWLDALQPRLRTLDDDLAQINEHRNGIITRLHGMVDAAVRTLRLAQRLSKLLARLEPKPVMRAILTGGLVDPTELREDYLDELLSVGRRPGYPAVARAVYRSLPSLAAARARYPKVTAPVHLIYGEKDWSRPSSPWTGPTCPPTC
jgi:chromosome segregation ATPase